MMRRLMILVMMTCVLGLTFAVNVARGQSPETERIAIAELKERIDSGEKMLLIDVREDHELEEHGAIPGAIHIPMGDLDRRMPDIPKDVQLVFY